MSDLNVLTTNIPLWLIILIPILILLVVIGIVISHFMYKKHLQSVAEKNLGLKQ